jgi:hypothetical protein
MKGYQNFWSAKVLALELVDPRWSDLVNQKRNPRLPRRSRERPGPPGGASPRSLPPLPLLAAASERRWAKPGGAGGGGASFPSRAAVAARAAAARRGAALSVGRCGAAGRRRRGGYAVWACSRRRQRPMARSWRRTEHASYGAWGVGRSGWRGDSWWPGAVSAALARQGGAGWRPDPDGPDLGPAGSIWAWAGLPALCHDKPCELVVVVRRDAGG